VPKPAAGGSAGAAGSSVVLTLSLIVFALDIPLLLGFSVARYQDPAVG
jgi:hypothetical protein